MGASGVPVALRCAVGHRRELPPTLRASAWRGKVACSIRCAGCFVRVRPPVVRAQITPSAGFCGRVSAEVVWGLVGGGLCRRLITFALQQRVFVLAVALALAISGWYAWRNLPIEAFPDVQDVQVQIITQVPGQAPEEVERTVTLPIEREMSGVPRMTQLRSVSITGLSVVTLTFADGTDDYFARQQVLEKLQGANLPPNIQTTLAPLSNAVGEIYRYVIDAPPDMPLTEVRALQDWTLQARAAPHAGRRRHREFRRLGQGIPGQGQSVLCCASTRSPSISWRRRWRTTAPIPAAACSSAATRRW